MLSAIVQKVTGQKVIDYLNQKFFKPLGISDVDWETDPNGVNVGGWGLRLHTEDMAKMGQFYLQKGKWNGKQLLPESWINEATTAHSNQWPSWIGDTTGRASNDWMQGYCYQFWRCTHNCFRADGAFGQYIVVMPEKDAVVVITSESADLQGELSLIWKYIFPALGDKPLPADNTKAKELKKLSASLALPLLEKSDVPALADFSGKKYVFDNNTEKISTISVKPEGDIIELTLGNDVIPFGMNKWEYGTAKRKAPGILRLKSTGQDYKTAGCYRWIDNQTLELKLRYIESPHSETFTLKFDGNNLNAEIKPSIPFEGAPVKLAGKAE
jgi:hypothetical protein